MVVEQDVHTQTAAGPATQPNDRPRGTPGNAEPEGPELLLRRCRSSAKAGRWEEVEHLAAQAVRTYPAVSCFHTQLAWAVHQQGRTLEGLEIVRGVAVRFPNSVGVAYTMACLLGARQKVREAKRWLGMAIQLASNPDKVKLRSLVQPELQCVWSEGGPDEAAH
jgi:hypothetical protein